VLALLGAGEIAAQTQPSRSAEKAPASTAGVSPTHDENLVATREQLLKLLRISPKLTTVIVRDPSLLANQEYVSRNNPELAQFLQGHPEIVRNPEFYLFSNLGGRGKFNPAISLEQEVWPNPNTREPEFSDLPKMLGVFLFFICILASLIWLLRVLLESRRWSRMLKLQTEVHSRLLDKFATNEDLLAYMNSEAGKRYLELAPVAAGFDASPYRGNPIAKVVTPMQVGVVLALVGTGFFYLRSNIPGTNATAMLLILGTIALMLGLGFIIAAGLSWALAWHFGLLPRRASANPQGNQGIDTIERR
jgi:hypothetical protein